MRYMLDMLRFECNPALSPKPPMLSYSIFSPSWQHEIKKSLTNQQLHDIKTKERVNTMEFSIWDSNSITFTWLCLSLVAPQASFIVFSSNPMVVLMRQLLVVVCQPSINWYTSFLDHATLLIWWPSIDCSSTIND